MAATGEMQRHAGNEAADRNRVVLAPGAAPRPRQRHDLVLGGIDGMRKGGVDHLAPGEDAFADRDIEVFGRGAAELLQHRLQRPLREFLAFLTERLLHDRRSEIEVLGARMRARALPVTTKRSQVGDGVCAFDVTISTWSPLTSSVRSGNSRPLILAPTQVSPICEWTA